MTRKELAKEFQQQLYLQASFFKMKTLGAAKIDKEANESVQYELNKPFPNPHVKQRFIVPKEVFPKLGQIARGEEVTKANATNGPADKFPPLKELSLKEKKDA